MGFKTHLKKQLFAASAILFCFWVSEGYASYAPIYSESELNGCSPIACQQEALGPLLESRRMKNGDYFSAIRPLALRRYDNSSHTWEHYFLYPLLTHRRSAEKTSWSLFNYCMSSQIRDMQAPGCPVTSYHKVFFPFYITHQTGDPCTSYRGIFPLGGRVQNHFGVDSLHWVLFPAYLGVERKGSIRHHLFWPFLKYQCGNNSCGIGLWPLFGSFAHTGHYKSDFFLWPLVYKKFDQLNSKSSRIRHGFLPFYAYECSEQKRVQQVIWPFFSHIRGFGNKPYVEDQFLWPLFVQRRSCISEECPEFINRWAPIYSHSYLKNIDKRWFFWPLLKLQYEYDTKRITKKEQLLFFIFNRKTQWEHSACGAVRSTRTHLWPLFSYWNSGQGQKQFQILSPLAVFFPDNKVVQELYSPLFSFIRISKDAPGHIRQNILFNFIQAEKSPSIRRFSMGPLLDYERHCGETPCKRFELLKGLFGYIKTPHKRSFKFLWIAF